MNFLKSVFSDDPDPRKSPPSSPTNPNPESSNPTWNFNTLIKTITTKSDTIISTYKRDLVEFQSGLKKETQAATQAIKELPSSLEASASVWRGAAQIILNNSKEYSTINPDTENNNMSKYNRFELQVNALRNDLSTYTDDVEDELDFTKWKLGFEAKENEEIESLVGENGVLKEVYEKVVPSLVDREVFWERYFYRVFKLKQVEEARVSLVKRAISGEEEDLSWDVDDDESNGYEEKGNVLGVSKKEKEVVENVVVNKQVEELKIRDDGEACVVKPVSESVSKEKIVEGDEKKSSPEELVIMSDDGEALKSSELPAVSSGPSVSKEEEEEDIGWDEIEDLECSHDEKKVSIGGSPNRADLRKRLSGADEEEDLSWDIENDDAPVKR